MQDAAVQPHRDDEILNELADLGMDIARDLRRRLLAAKDDAAANELSLVLHRTARSIRQTLALKSRLERERRAMSREDVQTASREAITRMQKKRRQIRKALTNEIWNEREGDEAEALLEDLDAWVYDAAEEDGFLDEPMETIVARIRANLGLAAKAADGAADESPEAEPIEVVIWKSSG